MIKETWKPVVGYEDFYSVSNIGRVRRENSYNGSLVGRMLKPYVGRNGRKQVALWKHNKGKSCLVYHLVAEAFLGPRPPRLHINHKDGNPLNDFVGNLEYVTHRQNSRHAAMLGLTAWGERQGSSKLTIENVLAIREEYAEKGTCQQILAKRYGVCAPNISMIVTGKRWKNLHRSKL